KGFNPYSRLDDEGKTVFGLYKRLAKMANLTTGNVYFRVSKSALYSTQFKRLVKDLCPDLDRERIEGWEPYAEFVNRRLYSQFENIARIGERLANARDRLDRIIEIANLKRSLELTQEAINLTKITKNQTRFIIALTVISLVVAAASVLANLDALFDALRGV
ncbi:MAG: hypothetical protein AAFY32_01410, partial [Pseudomonadota bacterium]